MALTQNGFKSLRANMMSIPVGKAKGKIKNAVKVCLQKGPDGKYMIPRISWIPLYLFGPPGVGKTMVTRQVAKELGIGFVSFSLTHHTRNSLLGLPVISELAGSKYTEYTMSEVIAKVYQAVEQGYTEGILLLDEFNCASETVMPAMLEFLQTGNIGTHSLPEGWVLVLCGNPPEYNKSARVFDAAVMDRVRKIEVTAEYEDFAAYAEEKKLHPIVCEYLAQNTQALYRVGEKAPEKAQNANNRNGGSVGVGRTAVKTVSGRKGEHMEVVTPRGWENLSWALYGYEQAGLPVDEELIHEYLKSDQVAYEFYQYYWLNAQSFSTKEAEQILNGIDMESQAEIISAKTLAFRWKIVDYLEQRLESQAAELAAQEAAESSEKGSQKRSAKSTGNEKQAEEISAQISNAFRFLGMLPEKEKLQESLLLKINESKDLMDVLMKVRNEEYLNLCSRAYGVAATKETA